MCKWLSGSDHMPFAVQSPKYVPRMKQLAFEHIAFFQSPLQVGIDGSGKRHPLVQGLWDMLMILQVPLDGPHVQAT